MSRAVASLLMTAAIAAPARAEVLVGAGGALAVDGPEVGGWAGVGISPPGRLGARADLWATGDRLLLEGAATVTLGATRPHLAVTLHLGGGADLRRAGVAVAAGLTTQIGLRLGPLALVLDATLHGIGWPAADRYDLDLTAVAGLGAVF